MNQDDETQLGLDKAEFRRVAHALDPLFTEEKFEADWAVAQANKAARLKRLAEAGTLYLH